MFYGSLLSTHVTLIRKKNASSINPLLAIASFINSLLWTVYGFAVLDWFIAIPNGLGVCCGLLQFAVLWLYRGAVKDEAGSSRDDFVVVEVGGT